MEYTFSYREKNGSICLILSYKVGTKWRQKTKQGFKNQREARRYQDELLAQVKELEGLTDDATLQNITLQQFLPIFMRDKKEFLAPNTLKNYALALKKMGNLATVPIRDISTANLTNALMQIEGKASSKKAHLRCISPVLEHAKEIYKIIPSNPAKGIKLPQSKDPTVLRAFTKEELAKLQNIVEFNPIYSLIIALAANTGMRFGEIYGLPWNAIDWFKKTITITQQYTLIGQNIYGIGPCKTRNSHRTIPASPLVLQRLKKWRDTRPMEITGTVFPIDKGHSVQTELNRVIGRNFPGRSIHALRHTFATLLLSRTGDINLVAHVLGDTVATVCKVYVNYTDDINKVAARAIESLY